jgi:hypothetical protein
MSDPSPLAPRYLGNVMFAPIGDRVATWPLHNYATMVPGTYVNPGNANYQLLTPYWTDTSDGRLSGIDWATLQAAIGGSISVVLHGSIGVLGSSSVPGPHP